MRPKRGSKPTISNRWFSGNFRLALTPDFLVPIPIDLAKSARMASPRSGRRLQRAKPSGAGERLSAINFASATPSKIRGRAELGLHLRLNTDGNREETPPSAAIDLLKGFAPAIDEVAHQRAAVLAADHARVRQAVDTRQVRAGGAVEVEPVLPPDIIGFYVPLPVID
jgi:hypothetical protein